MIQRIKNFFVDIFEWITKLWKSEKKNTTPTFIANEKSQIIKTEKNVLLIK